MRVLGLIPARAGSKGIPHKNITPLAGVSPLERAIHTALESGVFERIIVSTDSEEIARIARKAGAEAPFLRPPELATDVSSMLDVVRHALRHVSEEGWRPDAIVLLQPTAPLRTPADIEAALDMMEAEDCDSVVSVTEIPDRYNPHWALTVHDGFLRDVVPGGRDVTRRQELPTTYMRDGSLYATKTEVVESGSLYGERSRALEIPPERSVNLDSPEDWDEAERRLSRPAS